MKWRYPPTFTLWSINSWIDTLIIRGGENIYPAEIEAVCYYHPAVKEGQDIDEQAFRDLLASEMAKFKVPRYIWLRSEPLPGNPSGKILKKQLREQYNTS